MVDFRENLSGASGIDEGLDPCEAQDAAFEFAGCGGEVVDAFRMAAEAALGFGAEEQEIDAEGIGEADSFAGGGEGFLIVAVAEEEVGEGGPAARDVEGGRGQRIGEELAEPGNACGALACFVIKARQFPSGWQERGIEGEGFLEVAAGFLELAGFPVIDGALVVQFRDVRGFDELGGDCFDIDLVAGVSGSGGQPADGHEERRRPRHGTFTDSRECRNRWGE